MWETITLPLKQTEEKQLKPAETICNHPQPGKTNSYKPKPAQIDSQP